MYVNLNKPQHCETTVHSPVGLNYDHILHSPNQAYQSPGVWNSLFTEEIKSKELTNNINSYLVNNPKYFL